MLAGLGQIVSQSACLLKSGVGKIDRRSSNHRCTPYSCPACSPHPDPSCTSFRTTPVPPSLSRSALRLSLPVSFPSCPCPGGACSSGMLPASRIRRFLTSVWLLPPCVTKHGPIRTCTLQLCNVRRRFAHLNQGDAYPKRVTHHHEQGGHPSSRARGSPIITSTPLRIVGSLLSPVTRDRSSGYSFVHVHVRESNPSY